MSIDYWYKQTRSKPLFPELEWSRPENKMHAGKLLILGGNLHGFSAPAQAFSAAEKAGIGMTRVLLPDAIQKTVKHFMPEADFCPSTPSGSFKTNCLDGWLEHSGWADGTLLAGNFGKNSETSVLIESFLQKHAGLATLTNDAVEFALTNPEPILNRENTVLILQLNQLQQLMMAARFPKPITSNMDLMHLVEVLHDITKSYQATIITQHSNTILVAQYGRVSSTPLGIGQNDWQTTTAASCTVWRIQHPSKYFEAATTALIS